MAELKQIIASACKHNAANGITGYLMYDGIEFAQILEGDKDAIMGTFLRIASDSRHGGINILGRGPLNERRFNKWEMGLAVRNEALEKVFMQNGFLKPGEMSSQPLEPLLRLATQLSQSNSCMVPSLY